MTDTTREGLEAAAERETKHFKTCKCGARYRLERHWSDRMHGKDYDYLAEGNGERHTTHDRKDGRIYSYTRCANCKEYWCE